MLNLQLYAVPTMLSRVKHLLSSFPWTYSDKKNPEILRYNFTRENALSNLSSVTGASAACYGFPHFVINITSIVSSISLPLNR